MFTPSQHEYIPLEEQCLRIMTAVPYDQRMPALSTLCELPLIQMNLAESYSASGESRKIALEILRQSVEAEPLCPHGFKRELPQIITGENSNWQLWRADFYIARIKLCYVDKSRLTASTVAYTTNSALFCGCAYLVSPSAIGLSFQIPELGWQIKCEMGSSSPTGSHSLSLKESYQGQPKADSSYRVPSIAKFVPPHP